MVGLFSPCEQENAVSLLGAGIPDLATVDDVVIAIAAGEGLDVGRVETSIRLSDAETGHQFARDDRRQERLALLVSTVFHKHVGPEDVQVNGAGRSLTAGRIGYRLHHDRGLGDAELRAADRFRHADAEPASGSDRLAKLVRVVPRPVRLKPIIVIEIRHDALNGIADLLLLLVQFEREMSRAFRCYATIHGKTSVWFQAWDATTTPCEIICSIRSWLTPASARSAREFSPISGASAV